MRGRQGFKVGVGSTCSWRVLAAGCSVESVQDGSPCVTFAVWGLLGSGSGALVSIVITQSQSPIRHTSHPVTATSQSQARAGLLASPDLQPLNTHVHTRTHTYRTAPTSTPPARLQPLHCRDLSWRVPAAPPATPAAAAPKARPCSPTPLLLRQRRPLAGRRGRAPTAARPACRRAPQGVQARTRCACSPPASARGRVGRPKSPCTAAKRVRGRSLQRQRSKRASRMPRASRAGLPRSFRPSAAWIRAVAVGARPRSRPRSRAYRR